MTSTNRSWSIETTLANRRDQSLELVERLLTSLSLLEYEEAKGYCQKNNVIFDYRPTAFEISLLERVHPSASFGMYLEAGEKQALKNLINEKFILAGPTKYYLTPKARVSLGPLTGMEKSR